MKRLLIALLLVNFSPLAHARVGETEEQITARFGKPTLRQTESVFAQGKMLEFCPILRFRSDDWSITCYMISGKCAKIVYSKPGDWTEEQIQTVLSNNMQGANWKEATKPSLKKIKREWMRADSATAVWYTGSITIVTPTYELAKKQLQDRAKEQSKGIPKI